jgi:hypothetical protein
MIAGEQAKRKPDKRLRDAVKLGLLRGKLTSQPNGYCLHTLIFDKRSFPKRETVAGWIRTNGHLGAKHAAIVDKPGEWHVRQGSPDMAGLERSRVRCAVGVQAIVGMPRAISKGGPFSGRGQHIGMTVRPEATMPRFPDWDSLWLTPEARKRQDEEAEKSRERRRKNWRNLNFEGIHGGKHDKPELRFLSKEFPAHVLTAGQLRENQKRIITGAGLGYDDIRGRAKDKR